MAHDRFEYAMPAPASVVFDAFHQDLRKQPRATEGMHWGRCVSPIHNPRWRARWDTLVGATEIIGGGECPYVGAETANAGGGWLKGLSMRTRFISYEPGRVAAASMVGRSFPFARWAASMRHQDNGGQVSVMIYTQDLRKPPRATEGRHWGRCVSPNTYSFSTQPEQIRWAMEPLVKRIFDAQTHKRFERLRAFLEASAHEVVQWQGANRRA